MKGIAQGMYTEEFRVEAVKLIMEGNMSLSEVARKLSLPPTTLAYRVKDIRRVSWVR